MASKTPSARSMALLRNDGWLVDSVEHWNSYARVRQDLFGFLDLIAVKDNVTLGVQSTTYANISARVKKVLENPAFVTLKKAGWIIEVHGWKKNNGKWICKRRELTLDDLLTEGEEHAT
jgi:hypothetical protein